MISVRVKALIELSSIAFVFFFAVDGALTWWAVNTGLFTEQNPLMAPICTAAWFPLFKLGTGILAAYIINKVITRVPRIATITLIGLTLAAGFYVWIFIANMIQVVNTL